MKLFNYNQFVDIKPLNENLDKAKKYMKERFLLKTAAEELGFIEGELKAQLDNKEIRSARMSDFTPEQQAEIKKKLRELKLTDEQVRNIERDPDFLKIREFLGQKYIGWTYPFTYFYFVENIPMEDLFTKVNPDTGAEESIFYRLVEYSGVLDRLPKKFDQNFIDVNIPNNCEKLVDGLDALQDYRKIKRVIDNLTKIQKEDYMKAPEVIKDQFAEVAIAFNDLGGKDQEKHKRLWRGFFGEVKIIEEDTVLHGKAYKKGDKKYFGQLYRYTTIREFIKAAQNYLKSANNEGKIEFYEKINKCNERYGILGADIVFDENDILVIEVKSFPANQMLNGHTRHCIKDYQSQWDNYIGSRNNKQYYVYNFNIPQYDNLFTIGVTIAPYVRGTADKYANSDKTAEIYNSNYSRACHAKDDARWSEQFKDTLKKWEKAYEIETNIFDDILKPMTPEEIEKRERAKLAEREIVKKGLSIEKILQYVKEDGADINKDRCVALLNAVEEGDYEKTKTILELGGSPNLRSKSEAIINKAKNLEMIKLLVTYGSELTGEVFNNICSNLEAVEYCLKQGLDPNFDNSLPIRRCCRGSYKSVDDIGEGYFDVFKLLIKYGAKVKDDRNMPLKWAAEHYRLNFIDYLIELGVNSGFKAALSWINHARKVPPALKAETVKYLEDKIKKYES